MRNLKRVSSLLLTLALVLGLCGTALAAVEDTGFADVSADAYYAEAVEYCRDNGLMNGTSATAFSPDMTTSRAQLTTILWRQAGSPAAGTPAFSDVPATAYYAQAAAWANEQGIISGYSDGRFAPDDPITRAQLATVLWRTAGSPAASAQTAFADQSSIPSYAVSAVAWAQAGGIVNGKSGNLFDPDGSATRAQTATILYRYLTAGEQPEAPAVPETPEVSETPETPETTAGGVLVAYFSATGNTESVAEHLESILDADLYEIVPEQPYTSADLNYNDSSSRSQVEGRDSSARPVISGSVESMDDYDVIFLGYPIWNGQAPKIISTFLERYDFSGKTIVPFCTSASSGMGSSASNLHALAPDADWLTGSRFSGSASRSSIESWVDGLDLPDTTATAAGASSDASAAASRIRLAFDGHEVFVNMQDNATTRDFLTMLPTTLTFQDYAGSEKISYLSRDLSTEGAPNSYDPSVGDLILYAPWGNLAIFYRDVGVSSGPVPMGHVETGLDLLTAMEGSFEVAVSAVD